MIAWDDLEYWQSKEWRRIEEKLDDCDQRGVILCPRRELLFASLDVVDLQTVKVAIIGQDPYPDVVDATGLAFSIPADIKVLPYTLAVILREYQHDLHYPIPHSGDLSVWSQREGVLLWNAIPSKVHGTSMAHYHWTEWQPLTTELIQVLDHQGTVFLFLGRVAGEFAQYVRSGNSKVIRTAHPASERYGKGKGKHNLFSGSRPFTTINGLLRDLGKTPVHWRLT